MNVADPGLSKVQSSWSTKIRRVDRGRRQEGRQEAGRKIGRYVDRGQNLLTLTARGVFVSRVRKDTVSIDSH